MGLASNQRPSACLAVARIASRQEKPLRFAGLLQAADGTRTHDLLHGKQLRKARVSVLMRVSRRHRMSSDYSRLPGIRTVIGRSDWIGGIGGAARVCKIP